MSARILKNAYRAVKKKSPQILIALGIAEYITAIGFAVKDTPKAIALKEELVQQKKEANEPVTKVDIVKACWKPYIRTAISASIGTGCIIASSMISEKRNAAWAAAYTTAITAAKEYRDTVTEVVGEEKEKEILKKVDQKQIERNPVTSNEVLLMKKGGDLCYDPYSGRYFATTKNELDAIRNDLNHVMLTYDRITLNDLYDMIGLDRIRTGDDYGWDVNCTGLIDLRITTQMADNGRPCFVLGFANEPRFGI